ncbi:MAG: hypothetical protein E4H14_09300 [Candidatus Thorarchaeota archaeon]|nr:MAG: hypothetical protein E4H14_09300 [Candidatus Thorarchaeota archaeon]
MLDIGWYGILSYSLQCESSTRENIERWRGESQSDFYEVIIGINRQPIVKEKENMKQNGERKNGSKTRCRPSAMVTMENRENPMKKKQRSKERK